MQKILLMCMMVILIFSIPQPCNSAGMASAHFRIPTSVISAGSAPMSSAGFRLNSTLGQSTPLMDPSDPPWSEDYDIYPGFWYTIGTGIACDDVAAFAASFGRFDGEPGYSPVCDSEPDGDVDGLDLAEYAAGYHR